MPFIYILGLILYYFSPECDAVSLQWREPANDTVTQGSSPGRARCSLLPTWMCLTIQRGKMDSPYTLHTSCWSDHGRQGITDDSKLEMSLFPVERHCTGYSLDNCSMRLFRTQWYQFLEIPVLCSDSLMLHWQGPCCLCWICCSGAKHRVPEPPHPPSAPDMGNHVHRWVSHQLWPLAKAHKIKGLSAVLTAGSILVMTALQHHTAFLSIPTRWR